MSKERYLITSALPYANGPLHLGHLAGAYLPADIYVRYLKLLEKDVLFICGTDEHGVPITIKAEQMGIHPQELVDTNYRIIKDSFQKLRIDFSIFSRTSNSIHHETSQEFFLDIKVNGYLESKETEQIQCQSCKTFLADRYIEGICPNCSKPGARGDQCESCGKMLNPQDLIQPECKVCGSNNLKLIPTTHFYLALSKLQEKLETWILSKKDWKENVVNYCKNWFKEGLNDRAVTRDMSWGVPVPLSGFENKVLYVWFDAPIGYVSMTKEWALSKGNLELWRDYWQNSNTKLIHFIGKDNIVFHALIFPAMMMAKNDHFVLPHQIPANEFLNLESLKFSTSRNYAVWVHEYLQSHSVDALRYYLTAIMPENKDADFSWKHFQTLCNAELADIYGNFINRVFTFVNRFNEHRMPDLKSISAMDQDMLNKLSKSFDDFSFHIERFEYKKALEKITEFGRSCNKYFNDKEPWKTRNTDLQDCLNTLHISLKAVEALSILLWPIIPDYAEAIRDQLGLPKTLINWNERNLLKSGDLIKDARILFQKIEDDLIENELQKLQAIDSIVSHTAIKNEIQIEDFEKIDLRTATILEVESIPKSDKLLKLIVDLGFEKRQVVSGIAQHYKADELIQKKVILVANLKTVKLRGVESQGMILAIVNSDGTLELLETKSNSKNGSLVK